MQFRQLIFLTILFPLVACTHSATARATTAKVVLPSQAELDSAALCRFRDPATEKPRLTLAGYAYLIAGAALGNLDSPTGRRISPELKALALRGYANVERSIQYFDNYLWERAFPQQRTYGSMLYELEKIDAHCAQMLLKNTQAAIDAVEYVRRTGDKSIMPGLIEVARTIAADEALIMGSAQWRSPSLAQISAALRTGFRGQSKLYQGAIDFYKTLGQSATDVPLPTGQFGKRPATTPGAVTPQRAQTKLATQPAFPPSTVSPAAPQRGAIPKSRPPPEREIPIIVEYIDVPDYRPGTILAKPSLEMNLILAKLQLL